MEREKCLRIAPVVRDNARTLRRPLTPAEQKLWAVVRNRQLNGLKFRRQHPVGRYIADFYCVEHALILEVDGESHDGHEEYDAERTAWLNGEGYRVWRVTNQEVHENLEGVIEGLLLLCGDGSAAERATLIP